MFSRTPTVISAVKHSLSKQARTGSYLGHSRIFPYRSSISRISRMPLITISQSLDEAYTKHKVVPEVVDAFETQGLLTIEYNGEDSVALGNTLKVARTQNKPIIQFTLNSPNQEGIVESISDEDKFILVMTDPDAPSNTDHKWSEYLHWLITDLKLTNVKKSDSDSEPEISHILDYSKGVELFSYMGPGPPPKTGLHRYVTLLYKQDPNVSKLEAPLDRPNWGTGIPSSGVRDWIKKVAPGSKLLGVNFFYAQDEDN